MSKFTATCIISLTIAGCVSVDNSFQRASNIAYDIIGVEASSPICEPSSVPPSKRKDLVKALVPVTAAGLSDPTGLNSLDFAVLADDVPSIERFVAIGYSLSTRDIHGGTLLHVASLVGSKQALSFLLAHGADPNTTNTSGGTPLMVAVSENRPDIAHALLSAGASAAPRTDEGGTALHYALACKDQELIKALLAAGAPVDAKAKALATNFGVKLVSNER